MLVKGTRIGSVPALTYETTAAEPWAGVWGGVHVQRRLWAFPGYFPFIHDVVKDLRTLSNNKVEFDSAALKLIAEAESARQLWYESEESYVEGKTVELPLPEGYTFHGPPLFAHQRLGIAKTLASWRAFVFWDMGTGKTRTMIELFRLLKTRGEFRRALVLCPSVVLPTWERQVEDFSGGELKVVDLTYGNREKRLAEANGADVVLATYGIARVEMRSAYNELLPDKYKVRGVPSDKAIQKALDSIAKDDRKLHAEVVRRFQAGAPPSAIYQQVDYDIIVIDEGHTLGSHDSDVTRAVLQLSTKAARRYDLTGTPGDQPLKLYSQLLFLSPSLEKRPFWKFKQEHTVTDATNKYLIKAYKDLHVINAKVDPLATRMTKDECLDLPPVLTIDVPISLGPKQRARYNQLVEEMRATISRGPGTTEYDLVMAHGAARINKLLQISSGFTIIEPGKEICDGCEHLAGCLEKQIEPHTPSCKVSPQKTARIIDRDLENPKLDAFETLAEIALDGHPTNKVIVWAVFLPELDDLEALCKRRGWGYVRMDGTNTHRIKEIEAKFQTDQDCRVYIGQVASGIGITLTAANYTFYYSAPWDRVTYRQSFDRNNRAGQTRKITVYRLLGRDTVDELVYRSLKYKDNIAFTLTERITCSSCDRLAKCNQAEIRPFSKECKYPASAARPVARPGVIIDEAHLRKRRST